MGSISPELHREVERFLFDEASLLDEGRLTEWLDLLTDDVRYVMPVRRHAQPRQDESVADAAASFMLFDDDKSSLTMRVKRVATGHAHAEAPASVLQRLISNIRTDGGADGAIIAHSNFMVYQERRGRFAATFIGKRRDRLRREGPSLKLARRDIELAQTILPATISILF
jgi:3-phenylpropionate/cinnamic acid dioxygenase small subunit